MPTASVVLINLNCLITSAKQFVRLIGSVCLYGCLHVVRFMQEVWCAFIAYCFQSCIPVYLIYFYLYTYLLFFFFYIQPALPAELTSDGFQGGAYTYKIQLITSQKSYPHQVCPTPYLPHFFSCSLPVTYPPFLSDHYILLYKLVTSNYRSFFINIFTQHLTAYLFAYLLVTGQYNHVSCPFTSSGLLRATWFTWSSRGGIIS